MKEVTPKSKADELFFKFRAIIIDGSDAINDEMANVAALIAANLVINELDHYLTNKAATEMRPFDLSGAAFWKRVKRELQESDKA